MTLKEEWLKYTSWLKDLNPQQFSLLNLGADDSHIEILKHHFPFELPEELLQLYKLTNGQKDFPYQGSVFLAMTFLDIPNLIGHYDIWKELSTQELNPGETFGDYYNYQKEGGNSTPEKAIKIKYINLKWIPIFYDGGGNHIGLDLDPDQYGTYGQVINFGRDQRQKFVMANSLSQFFALINKQIAAGKVEAVLASANGFGEEANYYLMCIGDPLQTDIIEALRGVVYPIIISSIVSRLE